MSTPQNSPFGTLIRQRKQATTTPDTSTSPANTVYPLHPNETGPSDQSTEDVPTISGLPDPSSTSEVHEESPTSLSPVISMGSDPTEDTEDTEDSSEEIAYEEVEDETMVPIGAEIIDVEILEEEVPSLDEQIFLVVEQVEATQMTNDLLQELMLADPFFV